jgi:signal transduction histidine kinase
MTTLPADGESVVDTLRQAEQRFLDGNRRTDEFLATLGHEMRNPLSALSGALDVWTMREPAPMPMQEMREVMRRQVQQLVRLSGDLLDVARIAQGKFELEQEPVRLRQVIDGACEEVRPLIDDYGHSLNVHVPAEPIMVYGDASRLVQVFANLIQNAAKYTNRKGSLGVVVEPREGMVMVRVSDNGRGIEERMLPLIFEAFTQVGESRSTNDGLGIGLRLVKTIVELHGGSVAAHSEGLGRGSEFTVHLPVMNHTVFSRQRPAEAPPRGAQRQPPGAEASRRVH